jgi:hypothetical protein
MSLHERLVRVGRAYADPGFAGSLDEHGPVLDLPGSGARVLLHPIPGTDRSDAVGPYPLLSCPRPERLADDLGVMAEAGAVTFTAVLDPMSTRLPAEASARFDVARPFKPHFVTELDGRGGYPSLHHLRNTRRALARVDVRIGPASDASIEDWLTLWSTLVDRIGLSGPAAGSRRMFARQFALEGAVVLWAEHRGRPVAAKLALLDHLTAYNHLSTSSPEGRAHAAMYALDAALLELAECGLAAVHWGGTAGAGSSDDGLAAYKRGWANAERMAVLVGAVLDTATYRRLGGGYPVDPLAWFPAHRRPPRVDVAT